MPTMARISNNVSDCKETAKERERFRQGAFAPAFRAAPMNVKNVSFQ